MSVIQFKLTENHIKLLKHLTWSSTEDKYIVSTENFDEKTPLFNSDNVYDTVNLILNGKPENFNPYDLDSIVEYTNEQIAEWDVLLSELPLAVDVIMYNGNFNTGTYKTRYHIREWIKILG